MKTNCANLYYLSTLACQLAACLDEKEAEILSADLLTIADMFTSLLARQSACENN